MDCSELIGETVRVGHFGHKITDQLDCNSRDVTLDPIDCSALYTWTEFDGSIRRLVFEPDVRPSFSTIRFTYQCNYEGFFRGTYDGLNLRRFTREDVWLEVW